MTGSTQATESAPGVPVIDVRGVSKWFGNVVAVNDVSLQVYPGITGLLGPNGAGKTTLLDLMAVQLKPTTGTLRSAGTLIRWGDSAWKAQFSFIRELPSFYRELTVAQTLELAGQLYPRWDSVLADILVGLFRLQPHQRVGHLSKGTALKLGIVTALSHRAALLILDEPTAGLDPTARADLQDTIRSLIQARPSVCVLLSSHIFEDVEATATEILILQRGRLVFRATTETLQDSALYRSTAPEAVAASPGLLLRWRRHQTEWLLVRRGSVLDTDLRLLMITNRGPLRSSKPNMTLSRNAIVLPGEFP